LAVQLELETTLGVSKNFLTLTDQSCGRCMSESCWSVFDVFKLQDSAENRIVQMLNRSNSTGTSFPVTGCITCDGDVICLTNDMFISVYSPFVDHSLLSLLLCFALWLICCFDWIFSYLHAVALVINFDVLSDRGRIRNYCKQKNRWL